MKFVSCLIAHQNCYPEPESTGYANKIVLIPSINKTAVFLEDFNIDKAYSILFNPARLMMLWL